MLPLSFGLYLVSSYCSSFIIFISSIDLDRVRLLSLSRLLGGDRFLLIGDLDVRRRGLRLRERRRSRYFSRDRDRRLRSKTSNVK